MFREEKPRDKSIEKKNKKNQDADGGDLPDIIKRSLKTFAQTNKVEEFKSPTKKKNKKKSHDSHGSSKGNFDEEEKKFLAKELESINTPYCNFSDHFNTILHF